MAEVDGRLSLSRGFFTPFAFFLTGFALKLLDIAKKGSFRLPPAFAEAESVLADSCFCAVIVLVFGVDSSVFGYSCRDDVSGDLFL